MKILFLHSSSDLYGASKVFKDTISACVLKGFDCQVVLSDDGPLASDLVSMKVPVRFIRLGVLRRKYATPLGMLNRLYHLTCSTFQLRSLLIKDKIDLVYNNASSILAGCFAAKMTGTKHLWHIHEIFSDPVWLAKFTSHNMKRFSDKNVFVSSATKQHWMTLNPQLASIPNIVIHNGIKKADDSKTSNLLKQQTKDFPHDTIWIGMIARVHFWKGQMYFLDLAAELLQEHTNIRFLMAGDAFPGNEYLYDEISKKKNLLGITDKVVDVGYVENPYHFFELLDIFILPSILPDPLPTTILESMLSGVPVVATNHGGAMEMIEDEVNGLLIPWDNVEVATSKISKLIKSNSLRIRFKESGFKKVLNDFSPESYSKNILRFIEEV